MESLRGRVDLVVVLRTGKARELVEIIGKPWCAARHQHAAILEHRGLSIQPHDLIGAGRRLVGRDAEHVIILQILDQLRSGRFVLD